MITLTKHLKKNYMVTKLSFKFETTPFIHCLILFR